MQFLLTEQQFKFLTERKQDVEDLKIITSQIRDWWYTVFPKQILSPQSIDSSEYSAYGSATYEVHIPIKDKTHFLYLNFYYSKSDNSAKAELNLKRKPPHITINLGANTLPHFTNDKELLQHLKKYVTKNSDIFELLVHEIQHYIQRRIKGHNTASNYFDNKNKWRDLNFKRKFDFKNKEIPDSLKNQILKHQNNYFKNGGEIDAYFKQFTYLLIAYAYLEFEMFKSVAEKKSMATPENVVPLVSYVGTKEKILDFISDIKWKFKREGYYYLLKKKKFNNYLTKKIWQLAMAVQDDMKSQLK